MRKQYWGRIFCIVPCLSKSPPFVHIKRPASPCGRCRSFSTLVVSYSVALLDSDHSEFVGRANCYTGCEAGPCAARDGAAKIGPSGGHETNLYRIGWVV